MGIEDAFLHDILAHPDDDAPRLIYADWLDEHNKPRGEFIRVQCALAQLSDEDPRRWSLQLREQELLREHEATWVPKSIASFSEWVFRRGFIEEITLRGQHFLNVADRIFEEAPIRYIRLSEHTRTTVRRGAIRERIIPRLVMHSPNIRRLRGLSLAFFLTVEDLVDLSDSPYLDSLTDLGLHGLHPSVENYMNAWERLLLRPILRSLDLSGSDLHLHSSVIPTLAQTSHVSNLRRLNLANTMLTIEELRALASSSSLTNLRELNLSGNRLTHEASRVLAEGYLLPRLERLNLDSNLLGDAGALVVREWPVLPCLDRLSLGHNQIFASGVQALAKAPALRELISLDVFGNIGCDDGAAALALSSWTRLQALNLWFNGVGDRGVQALAHSDMLSQLTRLNLTANCVTSVGARALIESRHLPSLARLDLQRNDIAAEEQQRLRDRFGPYVYC